MIIMTLHTLEKIKSALKGKFDEDRVHTALFLSYALSVDKIINMTCVTSPLYSFNYDEKTNNLGMEELYGLSLPPEDGELTISLEDLIYCCNIRDIPGLLEGETGVGKTFT